MAGMVLSTVEASISLLVYDDSRQYLAMTDLNELSTAAEDAPSVKMEADVVPSSIASISAEPISRETTEEREHERDFSPKKELQIDYNQVDPVATIGGSSTRKYLNEHVTRRLLEGMKLAYS